MFDNYKNAYNRLWETAKPIAKKYNTNKFRIIADALWSFIRYGITPNEYLGWKVYEMSSLKRKTFYTARHSYKFEKIFNDSKYTELFCRKEITNKIFKDYVKRDWIYVPDATDEEVKKFISSHTDLIVKPNNLSSGRGIHRYKGDTIDEMRKQDCLIEEFITQHKDMMALNPSSVNSVRVYTIAPTNNSMKKLDILACCVRVGGAGSEVDNYHMGGVVYPVDQQTGIIYKPGADIRGNDYIFHPSTGVKVVGFEIPHYTSLKDYIKDLCSVVPGARLIAWDLAVTYEGFDLIEANVLGDPGMMQALSKQGQLKKIKSYLR